MFTSHIQSASHYYRTTPENKPAPDLQYSHKNTIISSHDGKKYMQYQVHSTPKKYERYEKLKEEDMVEKNDVLQERISQKIIERKMEEKQSKWVQEVEYVNKIKTNNERIYKDKIKDLQRKLGAKSGIKEQPIIYYQKQLIQKVTEISSLTLKISQLNTELTDKQQKIHTLIQKLQKTKYALQQKTHQLQTAQHSSPSSLNKNYEKEYQNLKHYFNQLSETNQTQMLEIENYKVDLKHAKQTGSYLEEKFRDELGNVEKRNKVLEECLERKQEELRESYQHIRKLSDKIQAIQKEMGNYLKGTNQTKNTSQASINQILKKNCLDALSPCPFKQEVSYLKNRIIQLEIITKKLNNIESLLISQDKYYSLERELEKLQGENEKLQEQARESEETIFILERNNGSLRKQLICANEYIQERQRKQEEQIEKYRSRYENRERSKACSRVKSERGESPAGSLQSSSFFRSSNFKLSQKATSQSNT